MTEKNRYYKDFSNRRPFNNIPCREDQCLAPILVDDDYRDYLKDLGMDWNNLETWHFMGSSEPVLVAFVQVERREFDSTMKYFNRKVREFLNRHKNNWWDGLESIEAMKEDLEDPEKAGHDPTGTIKEEDNALAGMVLEMLVDDLDRVDPRYGSVFKMLMDGARKGEILSTIDLGVAKSQGYELIKKVRQVAWDLYNKE